MALHLKLANAPKVLNQHYPRHLFWGDGSVFFAQRTHGEGYYKDFPKVNEALYPDASLRYSVDFWDPNTEMYSQIIRPQEGDFHIRCGDKRATLHPVPAGEAKALLEKAKFYAPQFMRMPHFLARDDRGIYYYIDKSAKEGEKDFKIYIGKSGQLKRTRLQNIVQDSAGEIFATPNGSLRIVIDKKEALWVRDQKRQPLVMMDRFDLMNGVPYKGPNLRLVFGELGVYSGQKVGTPCDDL